MSDFVVKVGEFAGPIELLLNLIEERRLHISQVSLAAVADDFVAYVDQLGESADKNVLANFIWTAATLMLIKSVALLPNLEITPEEKSNVEELELRLKLYQQFKDLSEQVKDIFGKQFIFAREANKEATRVFVPSSEINLAGISEAMSAVLRSLPVVEKVPQVVVQKVISLEEMIESLKDRMTRAIKMSFKDFVGDKKEKVNVIISFLGMLELVKRGLIRAEQGSNFSDITMEQTELDVPRYLWYNFATVMDTAATIEAILFWKAEPISIKQLATILHLTEGEISTAVQTLRERLQARGVQVLEKDGEVMLGTHPEASAIIEQLTKEELNRDLGKAGLETLTIVLYKGPITRAELDYIRGVNSSFILRHLTVRGLVDKVVNPADSRSFLYQPSFEVLQHLGITKKEELPDYEAAMTKLAELKQAETVHDN